jgi:ribose transport system substrate-binding protein
MKKLASGIVCVLAGLSVWGLSGCNQAPESTAPSKQEVKEQAAAPAVQKAIRIGMVAKSSTNPVFLSARTGAETAAKDLSQKHGIQIEIDWRTPPAEDGQVQAQRVAQLVNEGVDAILISCSDAAKVTGAINDAVDRGVPVMTFDSDAPDSKRFAFYGSMTSRPASES